MIDLDTLTIKKARLALDEKEFSAVDLAQTYLSEIEKRNKELNAYLEVYDDVLEQAKMADERIAKGESYPLLGIPLAIKDNILIEGKKVSAASKILENYIAPYDATAIVKLKKQGAVFLGRTNLDEFAMGGSTENSAFGVTKNPHDIERVAGGSSGGSVVAVAANLALGALGSDTGGSVREPASFCGIVGMKLLMARCHDMVLLQWDHLLIVLGLLQKLLKMQKLFFQCHLWHDVLDSTSIADETHPRLPLKKSSACLGVWLMGREWIRKLKKILKNQ